MKLKSSIQKLKITKLEPKYSGIGGLKGLQK